jgi:hypothetical protein
MRPRERDRAAGRRGRADLDQQSGADCARQDDGDRRGGHADGEHLPTTAGVIPTGWRPPGDFAEKCYPFRGTEGSNPLPPAARWYGQAARRWHHRRCK